MSHYDAYSDPDRMWGGGGGGGRGAGAAGALARSIRAMTVGTLQAFNERQGTYDANAIGEIDQQYQLELNGTLDEDATWIDETVNFEAPFINGTEERNVPFLYPHFTYGTVVTHGKRIVVTCNVREWLFSSIEDPGEYVGGCKIEIGIFRPDDVTELTDFTVQLHLNFQGWGGTNPPEADPDADLTDDPSLGTTGGA